ncbi:MAG: hypothetical protein ACOCP8_01135 [archaeon]
MVELIYQKIYKWNEKGEKTSQEITKKEKIEIEKILNKILEE